MKKIISVPDMMCENCVKRINNALKEQKIDFTVSLETKTVTVEGDENAAKQVASIIYDLGFSPVIEG